MPPSMTMSDSYWMVRHTSGHAQMKVLQPCALWMRQGRAHLRLISPIYSTLGHHDNWEEVPWSWSWSGLMTCTDYLMMWSVSKNNLTAVIDLLTDQSHSDHIERLAFTARCLKASCAARGSHMQSKSKDHRQAGRAELTVKWSRIHKEHCLDYTNYH